MTTTRKEREARYGLREGEYDEMLAMNGGTCWICCEPEAVEGRRLAIDHDHTTDQVRGLLCTRCNQTLGRMGDDVDRLRRAADYLERSRAVFSDCCPECDWEVCPPKVVIEREGDGTRFGYECSKGHRWDCSWMTRGAAWRYMT